MYTTNERIEYARDAIVDAMHEGNRDQATLQLRQLENAMRVSQVTPYLMTELQQALLQEGFVLFQFLSGDGYGVVRMSAVQTAKTIYLR
jgi:hypothetical protein